MKEIPSVDTRLPITWKTRITFTPNQELRYSKSPIGKTILPGGAVSDGNPWPKATPAGSTIKS